MTRPKLNARKQQTSVTLNQVDAGLLREIGSGNLSEGIAIMLRYFQTTKEGRALVLEIKEKEQTRLEKLDPLFG